MRGEVAALYNKSCPHACCCRYTPSIAVAAAAAALARRVRDWHTKVNIAMSDLSMITCKYRYKPGRDTSPPLAHYSKMSFLPFKADPLGYPCWTRPELHA